MSPAANSARIRRLEELALDMASELQLEKQSDIFLWTERLELTLRAVGDAARVRERADRAGKGAAAD